MAMGQTGKGDMAQMETCVPRNTLPMMTGEGQFGPIAAVQSFLAALERVIRE